MTPRIRDEATRKTIHVLLSLLVAALVWRLPRLEAASAVAAATLLALAIELARRTHTGFGRAFHRYLGRLLREREAHGLTGATSLALGYTVTLVAFSPRPALTGILVAGVADAAAAVVGKRFGRLRYPGGKSVEGSLAFLILVTAIVALLVPAFHPLAILTLALLLTGVEAFTLGIPDNLYLPVAAAAAVQVAALLTGVTFLS